MQERKKSNIISIAGMLTAIGIMVGFFKISISEFIEIRFSSLPLALTGVLFGPAIAAVSGVLMDIGGFIIRPTGPYFPGFTLSGALSGTIFGICLHNKEGISPGFLRVTAAVIINTLFINILLNSVWLSFLYGMGGLLAVISVRILKELVLIPINILLITAVLKPMDIIIKRNGV